MTTRSLATVCLSKISLDHQTERAEIIGITLETFRMLAESRLSEYENSENLDEKPDPFLISHLFTDQL